MQLEQKVMAALKQAMKDKDQAALRTLRAIKSAILIFQTSGTGETLDEAVEIKMLQKMVKQRKESATIFREQDRVDLATTEEEELAILEKFLPQPLSEPELKTLIESIIAQTGATSMKDMGKVMGLANQQVAGRAEGKTISDMVKQLLAG
ncbi:MAG: GatB/YqeY domain-containing protein [Saprospiraceae bacterium]|nr:GatB/YqeY domain-containing protein [Saprospiraceae bacterium]